MISVETIARSPRPYLMVQSRRFFSLLACVCLSSHAISTACIAVPKSSVALDHSDIEVLLAIPAVSLRMPNGSKGQTPVRQLTFRDLTQYGAGQDHFNVVIRNKSKRTLAFFSDNNSWGDPTLSLELTYQDGTKRHIRKSVGGYTANGPAQVILRPGEAWVREIFYNSPFWRFLEGDQANGEWTVKLQAQITQGPESHPMKPDLWVGNAKSPVVEVKFVKF